MAVNQIEDTSFSGLTCTPGMYMYMYVCMCVCMIIMYVHSCYCCCFLEYLLTRTKTASEALSNATKQFSLYSQDQSGIIIT